MRLTLYEIETILRKASIGAGLPVGLAEETGNAAVWLAERDRDGVTPVMTSVCAGMTHAEMHVNKDGSVIFPNARVAICGPSAIDLLVGEKTCDAVHLHRVDSVMLLIGLAGVAAEQYGLEFVLSFSNSAKVQVCANYFVEKGQVQKSDCDIVLTYKKTSQTGTKSSTTMQGLEVKDAIWHEAEELAARTYVPETQGSRSTGAGAGLTDND